MKAFIFFGTLLSVLFLQSSTLLSSDYRTFFEAEKEMRMNGLGLDPDEESENQRIQREINKELDYFKSLPNKNYTAIESLLAAYQKKPNLYYFMQMGDLCFQFANFFPSEVVAYSLALEYYRKSAYLYCVRGIGSILRYGLHGEKPNIKLALEEYQKVFDYFDGNSNSFYFFKEENKKAILADICANCAYFYDSLGEADRAIDVLRRSDHIKCIESLYFMLQNKSVILKKQGLLEEEEIVLAEARSLLIRYASKGTIELKVEPFVDTMGLTKEQISKNKLKIKKIFSQDLAEIKKIQNKHLKAGRVAKLLSRASFCLRSALTDLDVFEQIKEEFYHSEIHLANLDSYRVKVDIAFGEAYYSFKMKDKVRTQKKLDQAFYYIQALKLYNSSEIESFEENYETLKNVFEEIFSKESKSNTVESSSSVSASEILSEVSSSVEPETLAEDSSLVEHKTLAEDSSSVVSKTLPEDSSSVEPEPKSEPAYSSSVVSETMKNKPVTNKSYRQRKQERNQRKAQERWRERDKLNPASTSDNSGNHKVAFVCHSSVDEEEFRQLKKEDFRFMSLLDSIKTFKWKARGIGKPEVLRGTYKGQNSCLSRRITGKDRLVYKVLHPYQILILSIKGHYLP